MVHEEAEEIVFRQEQAQLFLVIFDLIVFTQIKHEPDNNVLHLHMSDLLLLLKVGSPAFC